MEKISHRQERVSLYEVKVGVESNREEIASKLEKGGLVQFIVTKNYDVFVTHLGHDVLRWKNGLEWSDIQLRGYARKKGNDIELHFYERPLREEGEGVEKVIKGFLGSLS